MVFERCIVATVSTENKNRNILGQVIDFAEWTKPTSGEDISLVSLDTLKSEIYRREQQLPIAQLVEQIISTSEEKGAAFSRDRLVYELSFDILGRPDVFIGYNISEMTLEQILEEDEKIRKGQLSLRTDSQYKIVWSERFKVYEGGQLRAYGYPDDKLQSVIDGFVGEVGAKNEKVKNL